MSAPRPIEVFHWAMVQSRKSQLFRAADFETKG